MNAKVNCTICNVEFERYKSQVKKENICSRPECRFQYCSIRGKRRVFERVLVNCNMCNKELSRTPYKIKSQQYQLCSKKCLNDFKSVSEKWKNRISATRIAKGSGKGKSNPNYGNQFGFKGENHPSYIDGRSKNNDYRKLYQEFYNEKLEDGEIIHHIDCNHYNNDPHNLIKCESNTEHLILHRSMERIVVELMKEKIVKFDRTLKKYVRNDVSE